MDSHMAWTFLFVCFDFLHAFQMVLCCLKISAVSLPFFSASLSVVFCLLGNSYSPVVTLSDHHSCSLLSTYYVLGIVQMFYVNMWFYPFQ